MIATTPVVPDDLIYNAPFLSEERRAQMQDPHVVLPFTRRRRAKRTHADALRLKVNALIDDIHTLELDDREIALDIVARVARTAVIQRRTRH